MIPKKAIYLSLPIALLGVGVVGHSTWRIQGMTEELEKAEATGRAEGAEFVATLRGAHAERQLQAYDDRRSLAMGIGAARRNRFVGIFMVAAAGLLALGLKVLSSISSEVAQDRSLFTDSGGA
jgi:hypothetical protein